MPNKYVVVFKDKHVTAEIQIENHNHYSPSDVIRISLPASASSNSTKIDGSGLISMLNKYESYKVDKVEPMYFGFVLKQYKSHVYEFTGRENILMALNFIFDQTWAPDCFKKNEVFLYQINIGNPEDMPASSLDCLAKSQFKKAIDKILTRNVKMYWGTGKLGKEHSEKLIPSLIFPLFKQLVQDSKSDLIKLTQLIKLYDVARKDLNPPSSLFYRYSPGYPSKEALELFKDVLKLLAIFGASKEEIKSAIQDITPIPQVVGNIIADYCELLEEDNTSNLNNSTSVP